MRHGIQTVVIGTTEQAQEWLDHFARVKVEVRQDDYASERAKPIKALTCTCCGEWMEGRDWWNQEPGYGFCDTCAAKWCGELEPGEESETYGVRGVHFLIPQAEKDNPPFVEDRGEVLYGLDERLRIEYDGYVFWKGQQIEHYSGSLLEDSDESKESARELIRRCEALEQRGEEINTTSVIWKWEG